MTLAGLIKKNRIALFLKDEENVYNRICKSQELSIAMNPETEDYDFICREMPETVLKYYKPSISQNLVMFKGDAIFEELFGMYYNLATDDAAKRDCLIVYMFDGDNEAGYKAWQIKDSTIVFDEMACTDNTLNFNINFGGDIELGTAIITDGHPVFTPASPNPLTVDTASLNLAPGGTATITISGGEAPYTATPDAINDVTVNVLDNVASVEVDLAADDGIGNIIVSDSASPANTVTIPIMVSTGGLVAVPDTVSLEPGTSEAVTVHGGTQPYTYNTLMTGVTVTVSGDTVTIAANNDATADTGTVTISDSDSPANTATVSVTITV